MEGPPRKKRTVTPAEYRVEFASGELDEWRPVDANNHSACPPKLEDTLGGVKWIRDHGCEGFRYRVVRVCFGPKSITVEKREVRRLA